MFIDLMCPKIKSISIEIIYQPLNQTRFLEQIIGELEELHLNDELYPLGYFNINVLFKRITFSISQTKLRNYI